MNLRRCGDLAIAKTRQSAVLGPSGPLYGKNQALGGQPNLPIVDIVRFVITTSLAIGTVGKEIKVRVVCLAIRKCP